jgi:hypothetical protein
MAFFRKEIKNSYLVCLPSSDATLGAITTSHVGKVVVKGTDGIQLATGTSDDTARYVGIISAVPDTITPGGTVPFYVTPFNEYDEIAETFTTSSTPIAANIGSYIPYSSTATVAGAVFDISKVSTTAGGTYGAWLKITGFDLSSNLVYGIPDLSRLAVLDGDVQILSAVASGVITKTDSNTYVGRTITGTSNQITVTNGTGVSGNPTISLPTTVYKSGIIVGEDSETCVDFTTTNTVNVKSNNVSTLKTDASQNILLNNATAETSSVGGVTLKQGTNASTSSADQISIFATSGANCTLGLRTEATVLASTPTATYELPVLINGTNYKVLLTT